MRQRDYVTKKLFSPCFLRVRVMYPVVDHEKCNGCGNCAEICPSEVYEMQEDKSNPIRSEDCIECWTCVNQCQTESIRLSEG